MDAVRDRQIPRSKTEKFLNSVAVCWNCVQLIKNPGIWPELPAKTASILLVAVKRG